MADKILVADDSLTIQKVVAITLANEPWVLVEATDESELFGKIRGGGFKLVLLDFNLSESKSGYELATELKKLAPDTAVLAMLGTFDSVEDNGLAQAGVDGKIVKPFDSQKFIQKCRELIEVGTSVALSEAEEASLDFEEGTSDEADEWVMDNAQTEQEVEAQNVEADTWDEETNPGISLDSVTEVDNALSNELEGWGVSVPEPIGAGPSPKIPPVIEGKEEDFLWQSQESENEEVDTSDLEFGSEIEAKQEDFKIGLVGDEDTVYPETDDLDYPEMDFSVSEKLENEAKPKSNLIALDQLSDDEEDQELPLRLESKPEAPREDLAREIESELSPDDFWAVDEEPSEDAKKLSEQYGNDESEDDRDSFVVGVGDPQAPIDPIRPSEASSYKIDNHAKMSGLDEDRIVEKVKASLGPMLEEIVRKYMDEKVEKVAWEIIPDVAENLIRKEIKEISASSRDS